MAARKPPRPGRIVRTPDEAFEAGWQDAANDRPLSQGEIGRLTTLLRPYRTKKTEKSA